MASQLPIHISLFVLLLQNFRLHSASTSNWKQFSEKRITDLIAHTDVAIPTSKHSRSLHPKDFKPEVAHAFGHLAQAAYCGPMDQMQNWTCAPCEASGVNISLGSWRYVHHQAALSRNATYVLIARLAGPAPFTDGCLVSLRGTELEANVLRDLAIQKVSLPSAWKCQGCEVAEGFLRTWLDVEAQVVKALFEIGCTPGGSSGLFVTGHSLGAAMATLATFSFKVRLGFKVRMAYAFESPRVGNEIFADAFDAAVGKTIPFYRVTHHRDPVVHLPPAFMGYRHVQYEVFYERTGEGRICAEIEDPSCSLQYFLYNVFDHCRSPFRDGESLCECPGWVAKEPPGEVYVGKEPAGEVYV